MDVTEHQDTLSDLELQPFFSFTGKKPSIPSIVNPLLKKISSTQMEQTVRELSAFQNRYYDGASGVKSSEFIQSRFRANAKPRTDIQVESVTHSFQQPSVIARIPGTDPKLSKEIIVIGGHQDSISMDNWFPSPSDRAPGADDNASGMATVLEAFRVFSQSGLRPLRTIEFMAYAGEERGLLGSQDIAQRYKREGKTVVAAFQLDMTMFPGASRKMTFIMDNTNADLSRFTQSLVNAYVHIAWGEGQCGYACSDHASWTAAGYPSVFPFEAAMNERNKHIHSADDTLDILDAAYGANYAKLALAFAIELSMVR